MKSVVEKLEQDLARRQVCIVLMGTTDVLVS
jgi:hypothetical protein